MDQANKHIIAQVGVLKAAVSIAVQATQLVQQVAPQTEPAQAGESLAEGCACKRPLLHTYDGDRVVRCKVNYKIQRNAGTKNKY